MTEAERAELVELLLESEREFTDSGLMSAPVPLYRSRVDACIGPEVRPWKRFSAD